MDKRQGKGTFEWPDGDIYEGNWENDKRCGSGTLFMDSLKISLDWTDREDASYSDLFPDKFPPPSTKIRSLMIEQSEAEQAELDREQAEFLEDVWE